MVNLLSGERLSLTLGTQVLLDEVSLGVGEGDRIGVVGRNGGGKSTLMRVLAGLQEADSGRFTRGGTVTVGMLSQTDDLDDESTLAQAVLGDLDEHEWAGDSRIRSVLTGLLGDLGMSAVGGHRQTVAALSGGERRRVALARLLITDPDVLLLDEPTNHLDVEGVQWLADFLSTRRPRPGSALVSITHDRWFLDATSTRTWEVVDGNVESYEGGYAAYVLAKAERERLEAVVAERRNNLLRKELAWLRRGPPARTSKPRFRIDAANALIADEPQPRDTVALTSFATTRLGKDVVDLIDAVVEVGDRPLLDKQTWRLGPGMRIGIVGVNGAGKSTLLRAISGDLPLAAGKRKQGRTVKIGFLTQDVSELDALAGRTVIDAVTEVRSQVVLDGKEVSASSLAKRLGFSGPRQQTRVSELSGGERRRLQLLRVLMTEPNLLLLDEPTNDLDIETLTSVEDVLDGWAGTLLVVSHDRYLLERMCDRQVALLGDGRIRDLPGGVEQYLELRAADRARTPGPAAVPTRASAADASASPASGPDPARARELRKDLARLEKTMARLEEKEQRLHAALVEAAHDHERATELDASLRDLRAQREQAEGEWLAAADELG